MLQSRKSNDRVKATLHPHKRIEFSAYGFVVKVCKSYGAENKKGRGYNTVPLIEINTENGATIFADINRLSLVSEYIFCAIAILNQDEDGLEIPYDYMYKGYPTECPAFVDKLPAEVVKIHKSKSFSGAQNIVARQAQNTMNVQTSVAQATTPSVNFTADKMNNFISVTHGNNPAIKKPTLEDANKRAGTINGQQYPSFNKNAVKSLNSKGISGSHPYYICKTAEGLIVIPFGYTYMSMRSENTKETLNKDDQLKWYYLIVCSNSEDYLSYIRENVKVDEKTGLMAVKNTSPSITIIKPFDKELQIQSVEAQINAIPSKVVYYVYGDVLHMTFHKTAGSGLNQDSVVRFLTSDNGKDPSFDAMDAKNTAIGSAEDSKLKELFGTKNKFAYNNNIYMFGQKYPMFKNSEVPAINTPVAGTQPYYICKTNWGGVVMPLGYGLIDMLDSKTNETVIDDDGNEAGFCYLHVSSKVDEYKEKIGSNIKVSMKGVLNVEFENAVTMAFQKQRNEETIESVLAVIHLKPNEFLYKVDRDYKVVVHNRVRK